MVTAFGSRARDVGLELGMEFCWFVFLVVFAFFGHNSFYQENNAHIPDFFFKSNIFLIFEYRPLISAPLKNIPNNLNLFSIFFFTFQ